MGSEQRKAGGLGALVRALCAACANFAAGVGLAVAGAVIPLLVAVGATDASAADTDDPHAHHRVAADSQRRVADYAVPNVKLVRDDGRTVQLVDEINDGRPVVLSFIYTTCTTICPLTSQVFSELQEKLGAARDSVHLMSISIDPEQDTPARLREYAQKFGAGPEWQHYTGTVASSVVAQQAFAVYRGDKMSHAPVTLVRTGLGSQWVRIDGFATPNQLLAELHDVIADQCGPNTRARSANLSTPGQPLSSAAASADAEGWMAAAKAVRP